MSFRPLDRDDDEPRKPRPAEIIDKLNHEIKGFMARHTEELAGRGKQLDLIADQVSELEARFNSWQPASVPTTRRDDTSIGDLLIKSGQFVGDDEAGGFLVNPQMDTRIADRLRQTSVMLGLAGRTIEMSTDSFIVPRLGSSVQVGMVGERGELPETSAAFQVTRLSTRKIAAYVRASREVLDDSAPSIREAIAGDLLKTIGAKLDEQLLHGAGAGHEMTGLRQAGAFGANVTTLGSGAGAKPTLADFRAAVLRLEKAGAPLANLKAIMSPRTWDSFAALEDLQERPLLNPVPSSATPRSLFGIPVVTSSRISITETVGGSNDCSWFCVLDPAQIVVGRRLGTRIVIDDSRFREFDEVMIAAVARYAGLGFLDTTGIELVTGVRP